MNASVESRTNEPETNRGGMLPQELVESLKKCRERDKVVFCALWIVAGTALTQSEAHALRREHIKDTPEGWQVRGKLDSRFVTASVVPAATEALREFRKTNGPVLASRSSWYRDLTTMAKLVGISLAQARAILNAPPAERGERVGRPRIVRKPKAKVEPAQAETVAEVPEPMTTPVDIAEGEPAEPAYSSASRKPRKRLRTSRARNPPLHPRGRRNAPHRPMVAKGRC